MRALLALALLSVALAGCTSPLPGLGGGDLTARQAYDRGAPRAQQWHADAGLVALTAPEAPATSPFFRNASVDTPFPAQPDGNVGDGRAPAWFLQFFSPAANRSLAMVVYGANGTILTEEDEDDDSRQTLDVSRWQVDSPQAMQVAMQDGNFSRAARAPDGGVMEVLTPAGAGPYAGGAANPEQDPMWILIAGSDEEDDGAIVFVNARTGERFDFPGFGNFSGGFGYEDFEPAVFVFQGQLTAASPSMEHPFGLEARHRRLSADLEWDGTLPGDRVTLEVRGPDGDALEPDTEDEGDDAYEATYTLREAGEYTAVVTLGPGATPAGSAGARYMVTLAATV